MTNLFKTSREEGLDIIRLALEALGVDERFSVRKRGGGVLLGFTFRGCRVERVCTWGATPKDSLVALALWLQDVVRSLRRGLETPAEAFFPETRNLADNAPISGSAPYTGQGMTPEEASEFTKRALKRLGLSLKDTRMQGKPDGSVELALKLPSGSRVQKSAPGPDGAALIVLWLRHRSRAFERGIQTSEVVVIAGRELNQLETTFGSNLLLGMED